MRPANFLQDFHNNPRIQPPPDNNQSRRQRQRLWYHSSSSLVRPLSGKFPRLPIGFRQRHPRRLCLRLGDRLVYWTQYDYPRPQTEFCLQDIFWRLIRLWGCPSGYVGERSIFIICTSEALNHNVIDLALGHCHFASTRSGGGFSLNQVFDLNMYVTSGRRSNIEVYNWRGNRIIFNNLCLYENFRSAHSHFPDRNWKIFITNLRATKS